MGWCDVDVVPPIPTRKPLTWEAVLGLHAKGPHDQQRIEKFADCVRRVLFAGSAGDLLYVGLLVSPAAAKAKPLGTVLNNLPFSVASIHHASFPMQSVGSYCWHYKRSRRDYVVWRTQTVSYSILAKTCSAWNMNLVESARILGCLTGASQQEERPRIRLPIMQRSDRTWRHRQYCPS